MNRETDTSRESILHAARSLFARYGLGKTTIDDIARSVRMGKGSLYYYFKSKEDLFKAVLDHEIGSLKEEINTAIEGVATPPEKMRTYLLGRMKGIRKFVNFYNTFSDDYLKHFAFVNTIRREYDAYEINTVASILHEGVESGLFGIKDVELTAYTIVSAAKGLEYDWALAADEAEIERNINKLLEVLFYGIMKR